ncbi:MAG: family 10 glycosylhydrolase [Oscillospiraceae bacterium]
MPNLPTAPTAAKPSTATTPKEVRAVWVSYLEFLTLAKNQTCASFTNNIGGVFSRAADYGLNTIMVQVRPFGDALYRSEYFPWSYVLTGEEGVDPGYDPLAVMVEQAQKYGLRIEAWINPYRIRTSSARAIGDANPAKGYLVSGSDAVIQYKGGTYYNPASTTARNLITAGAVEIVKNYDIDAIHFDDYFYPTTDAAFDAADYKAYQNSGGRLALSDWRRDNVNTLVKQVHMAIRSADSGVQFGISPQARMDVNYNAQYADVKTWVSNGWVDYICPQIYFGFEHSTVPYSQALATWSEMTRGTGVGLYIGLAAYKCGVADGGAGNAKNEWIDSDDLLEKMVAEARKESTYAGFALYRYDSIFAPVAAVSGHITQERENLASIL